MSWPDFVDSLGLRYFDEGELRMHRDPPPMRFWGNIVVPAVVVDELRHVLNQPIEITSAYRDPERNRAAGGGAKSQHLRFGAVDITLESIQTAAALLDTWRRTDRFFRVPIRRPRSPGNEGQEFEPLALWSPLRFTVSSLRGYVSGDRSLVLWRGGLHHYPDRNIIHLDERGVNRSWTGR